MTVSTAKGDQARQLLADAAFCSQWERLYQACPWATGFQGIDFVTAWYEAYKTQFEPVLVWQSTPDSRTTGLLTLATEIGGGRLIVAGGRQAEYQTWLADPADDDEFIEAAIEEIHRLFPSCELVFRYLPPGTPTDWIMPDRRASGYCLLETKSCPVLHLGDGADAAQRLRKKHNRSRLNQLARTGPVSMERITDPSQLDPVFDEIIAMYDFRQGAVHNSLPFEMDALKRPFHLAMLARKGLLHVTVLRAGSEIVAAHLGVCSQKTVHVGILAYSPFHGECSPSTLLILMLSAQLATEGFEWLDMTPGDDPYKERFSDEAKQVHVLTVDGSRVGLLKRQLAFGLTRCAKRFLTSIRLEPQRLKAIARRLRGGDLALSFARLPLRGLRRLFNQAEVRLYFHKPSMPQADTEKSGIIVRDELTRLLSYRPRESRLNRQAFLATALERLEAGCHIYMCIENGTLTHYGWMAERQQEGYFPFVHQHMVYPPDSACLFDFQTASYARKQNTRLSCLRQAMFDAAKVPGTRQILIAAQENDAMALHDFEKAGFTYVGSLFDRTFFGKSTKWSSLKSDFTKGYGSGMPLLTPKGQSANSRKPAPVILCQPTSPSGRSGEPLTCGIPWPPSMIWEPSRLSAVSDDGTAANLQVRALEYWPDGSVKWLLTDWLASAESGTTSTYKLVAGDSDGNRTASSEPASVAHATSPSITVGRRNGQVVVLAAGVKFAMSAHGAFPFDNVLIDGRPAVNVEHTGFAVEDDQGRKYRPDIDHIEIEDSGPIRATVRQSGRLVDADGQVLCNIVCRLSFFAGSPVVRFDLTLTNLHAAGHPGGCWDLGNSGAILLRDASLTVAMPAGAAPAAIRFSPEIGAAFRTADGNMEIYQDASGGDNWRSHNHLNRKRQVPHSFRGYRLRAGDAESTGLRATPIVCLQSGRQFLGIAMPDFWQNFPKAVEAAADSLVLRLFPRQFADLHEIQGGEQKTHTFHVAFGPDTITDEPLEWCRQPLSARCEPEWCCSTGALPYLLPRATNPGKQYLQLIDAAIDGPDSFEHKREVIDEYGWRHFGELYGDHEAVFAKDAEPLVSHYNNQYDVIRGLGLQFLSGGDIRWLRQMTELARHVIDIDMYHCDDDKSAYNHGLFWHTRHYLDADTGTHRAYPAKFAHGGGPNAGHLYTSGLLLHYYLTGDAASRDAVIELGEYVIAADDGRKTVFRLLDRGNTGTVTDSGDDYHGAGRASANAVNALLDAHRVTGRGRFLKKAEQLIRRSIHPADDLVKLDLPNVEDRWFYTMFLQVLGKYLDVKAELGRIDDMYAYAYTSLLHYARWMAQHESPYLDKPEILEYPTETWAAQDMRKSDVFAFAARHTSGEERAKFLERSDFFFNYSVNTLSKMPTRTLARPVVLLMTNGLMHPYIQKHPRDSAPSPAVISDDFGRPQVFVPQKRRAIRRFKILAATGVLAVVAAVAAYMLR